MCRFITIAGLSVTFLLMPAIYGMESDENSGSVIINSRKVSSERLLDSGEIDLRETLHKKYQAHIESGENSENLFVNTSIECHRFKNHTTILREELKLANEKIEAQMREMSAFKRTAKRLIGGGVITVGVIMLGITLYH